MEGLRCWEVCFVLLRLLGLDGLLLLSLLDLRLRRRLHIKRSCEIQMRAWHVHVLARLLHYGFKWLLLRSFFLFLLPLNITWYLWDNTRLLNSHYRLRKLLLRNPPVDIEISEVQVV